jgi:hypothetical protein
MGLFDWLKRSKADPAAPAPGLIVLLEALPTVDVEAVNRELAAIEPLRLPLKLELETGKDTWQGSATFDSHDIAIAGFAARVPDGVLEKTVAVSSWTGPARDSFDSHKSHILLIHGGGSASMAEKYIALYKLAALLGGDKLRGVLIEAAWTCAPPELVREFTDAKMLKAFRETAPPILFTGFVKFKTDDGDWFASKGHHMFGAPDLAMHGDEQPSKVLDIFMSIFAYMTSKRVKIAAGHTLQIAEETYLKFHKLAEDNPWRDWLQGKGETLEVRRIDKEEINKSGGRRQAAGGS